MVFELAWHLHKTRICDDSLPIHPPSVRVFQTAGTLPAWSRAKTG
jgi:hypothetical protein